MEQSQRKHKEINILVPKLLEQSKKYTKVFKDKKKIDNIFTEFEVKSSKEFRFFVKESLNRYKNMKLGNDLEKLMLISEKRRSNEVKKILTNSFFSDEGIKKEKENSKYYNSGKYYQNLQKTFKLLKESESDTSEVNKKQSNNDRMMRLKSLLESQETSPNLTLSKELIKKGNDDIDTVFKKEENKVEKMFDKYREDVKTLQQIGEQSQERYASLHKKLELSLPKLEMINYVHYEPPKNIETDIAYLQKKTLEKIMPFTQTFINNNKRNKTVTKSPNAKNKGTFKKLHADNRTSTLSEYDKSFNKKLNRKYVNTNDIVYNTAYKEFTGNTFIDEKRRRLNEVLGYDIPKIGNYKNIIKAKFNESKKKRSQINKDNLMKQKYASMTYYDKLNLKIDNEFYQLSQIEKDLFNRTKENENRKEKKNK